MAARKKRRPGDLLASESEAMREVVEQVDKMAAGAEPVLIEGEPGTGRELVARILHASSSRSRAEMVAVKAGAAPRQIFTCEIDGESTSAFEAARGGSLVVKDVCELGRAAQRRLARVIRDRANTDVKVLATAEPCLGDAAAADVFDAELYEVLAANRIVVPPLRERVTDIAPLADSLIQQFARERRRKITISTRAYDRLVTYPWPGNVAELKLVARRLVIHARGDRIEASDVERVLPVVAARVPLEELSFEEMIRCKLTEFLRRMDGYPVHNLYEELVTRVERPLFDLVMSHTGGNQIRAAEVLGLNRNTLRRKLSEHGMLTRSGRRASLPARRKSGTDGARKRRAGS